jgi:hypothetical protein
MYVPLYVYLADRWQKLLVLSDFPRQEFHCRLEMEPPPRMGLLRNGPETDSIFPVLETYNFKEKRAASLFLLEKISGFFQFAELT